MLERAWAEGLLDVVELELERVDLKVLMEWEGFSSFF